MKKEKSQLLGLREGWGTRVMSDVWEWSNRAPPPLRLMVELALSTRSLLQVRCSAASPECNTQHVEESLDWARARDPLWVSSNELLEPCPALGNCVCFGWHWDQGNAIQASTASKADDAKVDVSLWSMGGDGPGTEDAREKFRSGLHTIWKRRLTLEAG